MWREVGIQDWVLRRSAGLLSARDAVEEIIGMVRDGGDKALFDLTERFDNLRLDSLLVSDSERDAAYGQVDEQTIEMLVEAEARISRFHELQKPKELWLEEVEEGITLGMKVSPLDRIGAYIPGGKAAYPSTALMCVIPARVAGVPSVCCCTPPPVNPLTLVALDIAGADEIYQVGGAQAIAAMALGTETIDPVQKIVGPGNIYVTMAKMMLREHAEIDFPAGPSEIAILADETADPEYIAADILAQAEHDPHAACLLVTTEAGIADAVGRHLIDQVASAKRAGIIGEAMENAGYIVTGSISEGVDIINRAAPEHLSIQVADPMQVLSAVRHAGSVFVGPYAAVACGDYASGTNHVLPTAGYARMNSGLDVLHFCTRSQIQFIGREGLESIGDIVEHLAEAEGLFAHAEAVRIRRRSR
jgi:histidinol dehydrogenase